ncbi:uncharacterized protein N7469_010772 [Penicillium citrinum]|uniref:Cyanovirin-N domain-containing protein n=2 Tax=Penicillium TaxID=5073 RepID=A0A9W9THU8_PENCI|nr:uncharacterized protein N7469_010772 [Penicillium citrinum]KAJ5221885.1 hypothetical protein N7469_010772 [Penicillium citrinum]KAJ5596856.1 hypothetical protein N7450_003314 [Penicillium hetheringtonii]
MGFHRSSMDVHLKDGHVLCAYCTRPSGEATYSELDLNSVLGTRKGKFAWSAENFTDDAAEVNLIWDGPDREPMLHAQLRDEDGMQHEDRVNLAGCIKNEDGRLRYMDCF